LRYFSKTVLPVELEKNEEEVVNQD